MFKQNDIREILEDAMNKEATVAELKQIIINFVNEYPNPENLRCVFECEFFDEMCGHLGINLTNQSVQEMLSIFGQFVNLNIPEKEQLVHDFVENFYECSDDEDCCDSKIYIVIKNLSDEDFDIVKEYDSWEDAEQDIDDLYTGCCDDVFFAENVWFSILCSIQNREWDFVKNFCAVIEFNASGLEDSREDWENAWEAGEI